MFGKKSLYIGHIEGTGSKGQSVEIGIVASSSNEANRHGRNLVINGKKLSVETHGILQDIVHRQNGLNKWDPPVEISQHSSKGFKYMVTRYSGVAMAVDGIRPIVKGEAKYQFAVRFITFDSDKGVEMVVQAKDPLDVSYCVDDYLLNEADERLRRTIQGIVRTGGGPSIVNECEIAFGEESKVVSASVYRNGRELWNSEDGLIAAFVSN
jgi:hypothetical protein